MILREKEFCELLSKLRKRQEIIEEMEKIKQRGYKELGDEYISYSTPEVDDSLIIRILDRMFNTDMISYWCWELNYGREYKDGDIREVNGETIDISSLDKLYKYLVKEIKRSEEKE